MEDKKQTLMLFTDQAGLVTNVMTDEQSGKLFKSLLLFATEGKQTEFDDPLLREVYKMMIDGIVRLNDRYEKRRAVNIANGRRGGRPKKTESKAKKTDGFISEPKKSLPLPQPLPQPQLQPEPNIYISADNSESEYDCLSEFEKFWDKYPIHEGRDRTQRAFAKLIMEGWEPMQMIQAAEHYAKQIDRKGTEREYITRPWNFLSKKMFTDFVEGDNDENDANGPVYQVRDGFYG